MKKSIARFAVAFCALAISCCFGSSVFAEGEFNLVLNYSFKKQDSSAWSFDQYDQMEPLHLPSDAVGANYSYEWSNGASGSGTIGSDGMLNYAISSNAGSDSLQIKINNLPSSVTYFGVPLLRGNVFASGGSPAGPISAYSQVGENYMMIPGTSYTDYWDGNTVTLPVVYFEATNETEIDFEFLHEDGTPWTISKYNTIDNQFLSLASSIYSNGSSSQIIVEDCNGDKALVSGAFGLGLLDNFGSSSMLHLVDANDYRSVASFDEGSSLKGCSTAKMYLRNTENQGTFEYSSVSVDKFSKIAINDRVFVSGENYSEEESSVTFDATEPVTIRLYLPETATGDFSFDLWDGASDDLVYNLYLELATGLSDNNDPSDIYWTLDGETEKHYAVSTQEVDLLNDSNFNYLIQIPSGRTATLHNWPIYGMFHIAKGFPGKSISEDGSRLRLKNGVISDDDDAILPNVVVYSGENAPSNGVFDDGMRLSDNLFWERGNAISGELYFSDSGNIHNIGFRNGFSVHFYAFRQSTSILFAKEYGDENELNEADREFTFKVTLKDPLTDNPLKGKVAYYVYSDMDSSVDREADAKYAELNDAGEIEVSIKAGEVIRLGRIASDNFIDSHAFLYGLQSQAMTSNNAMTRLRTSYIPEEGMLPAGVKYTIEELDKDYSTKIIVGDSETEGKEYSGTSDYSDDIKFYTWGMSNATAGTIWDEIGGVKFINYDRIEKTPETLDENQALIFSIAGIAFASLGVFCVRIRKISR